MSMDATKWNTLGCNLSILEKDCHRNELCPIPVATNLKFSTALEQDPPHNTHHKFICWTSPVGQSQHASSRTASLFSNTMPIDCLHQPMHSSIKHQIPRVGSSWHTLISTSTISCFNGISFTMSFHLFVTILTCLLSFSLLCWATYR